MVGLGAGSGLTLEKLREAASIATQTLKSFPVQTVTFILPKIPKTRAGQVAQALSESIILSAYEFPYYKTGQKNKPKFEDVEVITNISDKIEAQKGLTVGRILANAVITTRDLGNHPANYATPEHLAKHARVIAKEFPQVKVKILDKADIVKEKMGALLAVSQGSDQEPKFIIMEYLPKKSAPITVLVGKGLTFDAGGISIKPSEKIVVIAAAR